MQNGGQMGAFAAARIHDYRFIGSQGGQPVGDFAAKGGDQRFEITALMQKPARFKQPPVVFSRFGGARQQMHVPRLGQIKAMPLRADQAF